MFKFIVIFFLLISPAFARVGETIEKTQSRFSSPPAAIKIDKLHKKIMVAYHENNVLTIITFYEGISAFEMYLIDGDLEVPDSTIKNIGDELGAGHEWFDLPKTMNIPGNKGWIRDDNAFVITYGEISSAGIVRAKHGITVFAPSILMQMDEMDKSPYIKI
jgi:hypothetical protein